MSPDAIQKLLFERMDIAITPATADALSAYLRLLVKWNKRTNLTALQSEQEIVLRHFGESLLCAQAVPREAGLLLDFGSGAGFPGAICALMCPWLSVCLAESQSKKAAFLMELARVLAMRFTVHAGRAETLDKAGLFDVVTLRAVDQMEKACLAASRLVRPGGSLVVLTTELCFSGLVRSFADVTWAEAVAVQGSRQRIIAIGKVRG